MEVRDLTKTFPAGGRKTVHAVSGVSRKLNEGETLGLVGESVCGKSTLGRMLVRLLKPTSGEIFLRGQCVSALSDREFAPYRRQLQMVFQDPYASLDPRMTVRDLIAEPLETWRVCPTREAVTRRVAELMDTVGLAGESLYRYPHQFSGGQRQRIGIARAVAAGPSLIVFDEPVSALDVSVQNQILNLIRDLQQAAGLTCLFISHDLSVIRYISRSVAVMFLGRICETGPTEEVFRDPRHPYTQLLLRSVPQPDPDCRTDDAQLLVGEPPSPIDPPPGCRFHTRCPYAEPVCAREDPPLCACGPRAVACHRFGAGA